MPEIPIMPQTPVLLCSYCPHPAHPGEKCPNGIPKACKCKGKPGFWRSVGDGLGNAIGESFFGGN